ncbi:endonuclease-reverse transcriptase [Trichonephila clavipes]|nr:endonuclease-reverse transcriptase [Trichonephila clavipes]
MEKTPVNILSCKYITAFCEEKLDLRTVLIWQSEFNNLSQYVDEINAKKLGQSGNKTQISDSQTASRPPVAERRVLEPPEKSNFGPQAGSYKSFALPRKKNYCYETSLRTIFGPVKDQGCWRTRYNFELYRLYKEPQVTQIIRSNRLRWLGHIWRRPENNQTRAYTFQNPMGSRTRGRPPTRWI